MARVAHRLTFADDGSAGADVAWLWLTNHPWPGWAVDVLSVQPVVSGPPPAPSAALPHPWSPPEPRVAFTETRLAELTQLTALGDPRAVLGARTDAALLVIGPRGSGVWKHLHLGSTAEWLLQCPPAPLVIARHGHRSHRVLVCVDGSAHADRAVRTLAELPWLPGCALTVLGVVEHDRDPAPAVDAAVGLLSARGASVEPTIRRPGPHEAFGNVRVDIFEALDRLEPDLVVLGTRGQTGLRRLRLGSTASAVAHHASCSVLLARAADEPGPDHHGLT